MLTVLLLLYMFSLALRGEQLKAEGWIYITPDGSVTGTSNIVRDGNTYKFINDISITYGGIVVQKSNIVIDGDGHTLLGSGTTCGFYIEVANIVTVKNVVIDDFEAGLLIDTNGNWIFGNTIVNHYHGFSINDASNNLIFLNTIQDNTHGVITSGTCNENKFFHNNFINNQDQVLYIGSGTNIWDDGFPKGGNYWSNHSCTGNPSNGSQPYTINVNNVDNYPFQNQDGWPTNGKQVPTLTEWGLIILVILFAGSGICLMLKRRRVVTG